MIYAIFTTEELLKEFPEEYFQEVTRIIKDSGISQVLIKEVLFPEHIGRDFVFNFVVKENDYGNELLDGAVIIQADHYLNGDRTIHPRVIEGWKGRVNFKIDEIRKVFK